MGAVYIELNIEENDITVGYFGQAPTVNELKSVMKASGLYERGIELNKNRISPFRLTKRVGMSGCTDWFIKYVVGDAIKTIRKKHILHVSMYTKVNVGVRGWLGDIVLVLAQYPSADDVEIIEISKQEYPINTFIDPKTFDWDAYFEEKGEERL